MPFGNTPPSSPATNPTGLHRTTFELPAGWKGRRVVLRVGSAESFLSVWANGTEVGFSKDSRLPAEFDLTPFLHEGRNALALMVIRYSNSSFIEDQDQWWLGGLHRSRLDRGPGRAAGPVGGLQLRQRRTRRFDRFLLRSSARLAA